ASHRAKLIEQVLHEAPKPLARIDRRVPHDLDTIIQKCLAKDPADRYASADALAEDLRRFLADRPIKARRHTAVEQLWRWRRRNPVVAVLVGLVTFLLFVLAVGSTATALIYRRQVDQVKKARADETDQLWNSLLAQARARIASRRPGQRFD